MIKPSEIPASKPLCEIYNSNITDMYLITDINNFIQINLSEYCVGTAHRSF